MGLSEYDFYHRAVFTQDHEDLRVLGGVVRLHFSRTNDKFRMTSGWVPLCDLSANPTVSLEEATSIAGYVSGSNPYHELVVQVFDGEPHLVWDFWVNDWRTLVDAHSGACRKFKRGVVPGLVSHSMRAATQRREPREHHPPAPPRSTQDTGR